jgi:drug/metabolite transporter (DMT)-like permease
MHAVSRERTPAEAPPAAYRAEVPPVDSVTGHVIVSSSAVSHPELVTLRSILQSMPSVLLLLIATLLEVSGDAVVRTAIYNHAGSARVGLFVVGATLLLGYGTFLNLAPLEFGQVVGLYIATLFVVWQVINFVAFRELPTLPVILGGSLIIAGGVLVTFWKP